MMNRNVPGKRYPSKQTLNLAQRERNPHHLEAVLPAALVLAVAVGLFCKFAVVDRLNAAARAEAAAAAAQAQLAEIRAANAEYDDVAAAYEGYVLAMRATGGVDPMETLELVEKELVATSRVEYFSMADSVVTVKLSGVTLNQISRIFKSLTDSEQVANVQVYTASTLGDDSALTTATMTIQLSALEGFAPSESEGGDEA
ncbi:hypothetical protein H8790_04295 [Oscillibacter hominis]|uniref:Uncharacterized protein n=1 Tax=Oscillibacter hominis TaxID=2763056 RepID=A0A7G9B6R4_9FIRM|nr:hypothetical protein [Oscillibacter hominis]QNL45245.1 hypothetical protein H8790_04295 [Oscillibacter hominis]